jgi:hypothetical protein
MPAFFFLQFEQASKHRFIVIFPPGTGGKIETIYYSVTTKDSYLANLLCQFDIWIDFIHIGLDLFGRVFFRPALFGER